MNTISTTSGTSTNISKDFPYTVKVDGMNVTDSVYKSLLKLYGGDMAVKPKKQKDELFTWYNNLSVDSPTLKMVPMIEKVIFNPPATIVMWSDGTKTVVKVHDYGSGDASSQFSREYGLAMCIAKKFFGSRSQFLKAVENGYFPVKEDGNPDEEA